MENEQGRVPYASVNNCWPDEIPELTGPEAIAAARKLIRFVGIKYRGKFRLTSGRRRTWSRRGVFSINAEAGWHDLIHDLSHWAHGRLHPNKRPHDGTHAWIEKTMIQRVIEKGWLDGKLKKPDKPKAEPGAREVRQAKLIRIEARIEAWRRKEQRARTALAKLARQRKYYEKALAA